MLLYQRLNYCFFILLSNHVTDIDNDVVFCKLPIEIKCGKKKVLKPRKHFSGLIAIA